MALRPKCIQIYHLYLSVSIHYAEVTNWPHVLVTYTASLFLTQSLLRSVPCCIDPSTQAMGVSTLWTLTLWWQRKKRDMLNSELTFLALKWVTSKQTLLAKVNGHSLIQQDGDG